MLNTAPQAAAFWTALLLILMVVLSALVVRQRRTHRVGLGDGGQATLQLASRAFGNAAEYIPAGIAAMILLSLLRSSFLLASIAARSQILVIPGSTGFWQHRPDL